MPRYPSLLPLVALVVALQGDSFAAGPVVEPGVADESRSAERVLTLVREAQAGVTSLEASIEQMKSYPQLGIEDPPERGRVYLSQTGGKRGARRVLLAIRHPEVRLLTIRDDQYLLYQPRINQAIRGRLSSGGRTSMFSGILTGSSDAMAALERDYVATIEPDARRPDDSTRLRFTARAGAAVLCQQIDLWVDRTILLPVRQACHEANGSVLTFTLSDILLQAPIDEEVFDVELPDDVELIESGG